MPRHEALTAATQDADVISMRVKGMSSASIAFQLNRGHTAADIDSIIKRLARTARARNEEIVDEQWMLGIERTEHILLEATKRLDSADHKEAAALLAVAQRAIERLARQLGTDKEAKSDSWFGGKDASEMAKMAAEFGITPPEV